MIDLYEAGMEPDIIGDIVFKAIREGVFYIYTDTKRAYKRMIQTRFDNILGAYNQNKSIHRTL